MTDLAGVDYQSVTMGTGKIFAPDPVEWVGSEGAVTCLGVFINTPEGVFVGHASCDQQVIGPGAAYNYVVGAFNDLLTIALGEFDGETQQVLMCFSGGSDMALTALKAGLAQWCGSTPQFTAADAYRIKSNGTSPKPIRHSDTPTLVAGPLALEVPSMP
jgi:hypothetical protein